MCSVRTEYSAEQSADIAKELQKHSAWWHFNRVVEDSIEDLRDQLEKPCDEISFNRLQAKISALRQMLLVVNR